MTEKNNRRVAIFQANWPVQSQTVNCAKSLTDLGFIVDLFLYESPEYVDCHTLGMHPNIRVMSIRREAIEPPTRRSPFQRFKDRLRRCVRVALPFTVIFYSWLRRSIPHAIRLIQRSDRGIIPRHIVETAVSRLSEERCHCLIGIEKHGLIWAGQVAGQLKVPFIYYNLELYAENHPSASKGEWFAYRHALSAERMHHRRTAATIVQDADRASVLFRDNGISMEGANIYHVPVSLLNGPYRRYSGRLQTMLGLPEQQIIILYFGRIVEERYVLELVEAAQTLPANYSLVMHGFGRPSTIEKVKAADEKNRIVLSLSMPSADELPDIIASASIGLSFYASSPDNDRLTVFSSEKMAYYMQCGVPFIAFDYPGYRRLADEMRCGKVVRLISELPGAISQIMNCHEEFKQNAYKAFAQYYDYSKNFAVAAKGLGRL